MEIILFNKPYGVVSQFSPCGEHPTLAEFGFPKGVYPAGRLDRDSEGLLILTDDGRLQNALTSPRVGHPRTYWAQIERVPAPTKLAKLASGVRLRDGRTRPCRARLLGREPDLPPRWPPIRARKTVPTAWLELVLIEGRNRQVRRMAALISHPVLRLLRVGIGDLTLKGLSPGQWRAASAPERARLIALLKRAALPLRERAAAQGPPRRGSRRRP